MKHPKAPQACMYRRGRRKIKRLASKRRRALTVGDMWRQLFAGNPAYDKGGSPQKEKE